MPARFFCQTGEFAGSSFQIDTEATIGRNDADVRLGSDVVSGSHARIYYDAERRSYFLEDLGSRNGTKLDGMPVSTPIKLGKLHVVTLADEIDFVYHEGSTAAGAREQTAAEVQTQLQGFAAPPPAAAVPPEPPTSDSQTIRTQAYSPGAMPAEPDEAARQAPQTIRTEAYNPGALPTEPPPAQPPPAQPPPAQPPAAQPSSTSPAASNQTVRTEAYTPGALPGTPPGGGPAGAGPPAGTPPSGTPPADGGAERTRFGEAFVPSNLPGAAPAAPNPGAGPAAVRFSLEVTKGERGRVTFPLNEGENTVGRASNCAVSLDDQSVSRQHAVLIVRDGQVRLRDLGSRNHTFLDGTEVTSEVDVPLGAVVRFGLESEGKLRRA